MVTDEDLIEGVRVVLHPWPEQGIDRLEVGVVEWIADVERLPGEGREAIVRVSSELRDPEDRDGIREVFFDEETMKRTEVF
jgi:hypothetical protein